MYLHLSLLYLNSCISWLSNTWPLHDFIQVHPTKAKRKIIFLAIIIIILIIIYFYVCFTRKFNLNHAVSFSEVSDDALNEMIKDIVAGNDQLGSEAVRAQLRAGGVLVQRHWIRKSLAQINPRAAALSMSQRPQRRLYRVAGPNSLWHLDGNHKLIR